jgi:hypothetical protein
MCAHSPECRRSCPIHDLVYGICTKPESATGSGRRRDAAAGHTLAHIVHDWLVIWSHAVTLGSTICAANIWQTDELVNEMGIQFCLGDMAAILFGYAAATKSHGPSPFALIQRRYGDRRRTIGTRSEGLPHSMMPAIPATT